MHAAYAERDYAWRWAGTDATGDISAPLHIAMPASRVARGLRAGLYEGLTNRSMFTLVPGWSGASRYSGRGPIEDDGDKEWGMVD